MASAGVPVVPEYQAADKEAIEFPIGRDSLKRFVAENLEVTIKDHNIKGPILIMSSQESDTKYCCSTYKKPQR